MIKRIVLRLIYLIFTLFVLGIAAFYVLMSLPSDMYREDAAPKGEARKLYEESVEISDGHKRASGIIVKREIGRSWLHLTIEDDGGRQYDLYAYDNFGLDWAKWLNIGDKVIFTYQGNYLRTIGLISGKSNSPKTDEDSGAFILEDEAIELVNNLPDIKKLGTKSKVVLTVIKHPTTKYPKYLVRVAEDLGDHFATYDFVTVDALKGKVVERELQTQ